MNYNKPPISIEEQINRLEKRGLQFKNKTLAANYLKNISYYRLRAYTYPFQNNTDVNADHEFLCKNIDFNDIIDIYVFDRRLRNLIFNELEKIEVAVRTKLSLVFSVSLNNAMWYEEKELYRDEDKYSNLMSEISNDVKRSNEDFIKHYKNKYSRPEMPPSWMTLEVVSFGTLSKIFGQLKECDEKKEITGSFGLSNEKILANWLHAFSNLRNCCAHHSRVWNRRFIVNMIIPYNTLYPFLNGKNGKGKLCQNKIFVLLSAIKYIVDIISPDNSFKTHLIELFNDKHRFVSMKEMGFPDSWQDWPVWKK